MADVIEVKTILWGQIVQHPKYGEQLQISRYERANPLVRAWSNISLAAILGNGSKTAQKIVDTYGENTIDEILSILKAGKVLLDSLQKKP